MHRIKNDQLALFLHDGVAPSATQFGNSVATTDEDGKVCKHDAVEEQFEVLCARQCHTSRTELGLVLADGEEVVQGERTEDEKRDNLEDQTGDHDINANIQKGFVVGDGGNGSSSTLHQNGHDIARDEYPGVEIWSEARKVGSHCETDVLEKQVDAARHESRSEGEENDG